MNNDEWLIVKLVCGSDNYDMTFIYQTINI